jgi:DNA-binding NarL/FixJ family response regulator
MPLCRVLVVEDHEPFRRALCALLQGMGQVVIVGEAADGVDAIHQASALQPDVVTLDIGLPRLGGIEVASQLRVVAHHAKILLVTNESSSDVVEEAFRRGTHGYVYKPHVPRDLRRAFDVIVGSGQFVGRLERIARGDTLASHRHDVLFYSSDAVFVSALSRFVASSLREETAVIVLATESHGERLRRSLELCDVDLDRAVREGSYIPLNVSRLLSKVMVDGMPDPARFMDATGEVVAEVAQRAAGRHRRVAACGECAPTLWARGEVDAAIQLEHLWDDMARHQPMDTQCAYPMTARQDDARALRRLCAEHTVVEIR